MPRRCEHAQCGHANHDAARFCARCGRPPRSETLAAHDSFAGPINGHPKEHGPENDGVDYEAIIERKDAPSELRSAALVERGLVHRRAGRVEQEIADYTAVLDLDDAPLEQRAWSLYHRAGAHSRNGLRDSAIADYQALLAIEDAPQSLHDRAIMNLRAIRFMSVMNLGIFSLLVLLLAGFLIFFIIQILL